MALTVNEIKEITRMMDKFVNENRPHPDIRHEIDIGWRLEGQSVYLFEIRPLWNDKDVYGQYDYAKATRVQSQKHWKIYWMRSNLKWYKYRPLESVGNLQRFLIETEKDPHGCF